MAHADDFVTDFHRRIATGDIPAIVAMYAVGAEIVRYDGVAGTPDEIGDYYRAYLGRHTGYSLRSIDQIRDSDDVVMWDASVDTDDGILQVVHVIVFDDAGAIRRHIPGLRGFWGK